LGKTEIYFKASRGLGLYLIRREKEIDGKRNKGRKPFYVKVCSIDRKGLGITIC